MLHNLLSFSDKMACISYIFYGSCNTHVLHTGCAKIYINVHPQLLKVTCPPPETAQSKFKKLLHYVFVCVFQNCKRAEVITNFAKL
jgi:hypothetical protein